MQNLPPPAKGMSRGGYYEQLIRMGVPHEAAFAQVTRMLGTAQEYNERTAESNANNAQLGQIAQVGGALAGTAVTADLLSNNSRILGAFRPTTPAVTTGAGIGGRGAGLQGAYQGQGASGVPVTGLGEAPRLPAEALSDQGFMSSLGDVDIGGALQTAGGAAQLAQAYQAYKSGDKLGAGIYGAAGAGNIATGTGAIVGAGGTGAGTMGSSVIPGLNIAAGAYGGYKTAEMIASAPAGAKRTRDAAIGGTMAGAAIGAGVGVLGGMAAGAQLGTVIMPGWGTAIGAAIGLAIGVAGSLTGSSKNKAQMVRDSVRGIMQQNGVLDDKWQGTLADGSSYDFGKDGKSMKWSEFDKLAAANPNSWGKTVAFANVLTAGQGLSGRNQADVAQWFTRAANSNAEDDSEKARLNILHFATQQGLTAETTKAQILKSFEENNFSESQRDTYLADTDALFGGAVEGAGATVREVRPEAGKVARLSPGMYRDDQGNLQKASNMRAALQQAYNK